MIIYKITNTINGKMYVGQTVRTFFMRKAEHKYDMRRRVSYPLYNAMNLYGFENFLFEEIDSALSIEELNTKEQKWIAELGCLKPNGYNLERGGTNKLSTPEINAKKSASRKALLQNKENHPNWGKSSAKAKSVICLNNNQTYVSARKAAIELQLDHSAVIKVCNKFYTHTKGFRFEYLKEI